MHDEISLGVWIKIEAEKVSFQWQKIISLQNVNTVHAVRDKENF